MRINMAKKPKSKKELLEAKQIRDLSRVLETKGIEVRRENLARGHAFRVKSGDCLFADKPFLFVDKRLPHTQQVTLLLDYIVDQDISLSSSDIENLSEQARSLLENKIKNQPVA